MSRLEELLVRIQGGDEEASAEFYRAYKPQLQRQTRAYLRAFGLPLRRLSDSSDICQVVLADFLVGSAIGRYDIGNSEELRRLLARIAARRVIDLARKPEFRKPAVPVAGGGAEGVEVVARESSPASQIAVHELIEKAEQLMPEDAKRIVELRKDGVAWEEIGRRLGKSPEAVRKSHERAARRVMLALGLEGPDDE
jgi:RNA polymerase sigma factor (sigma-70 family)